MIVALAGRRIDQPGTTPRRFPFHNMARVQQQLKEFFLLHNITNLVCSAACGTDLLALDVARELSISRKVILPFRPSVFKIRSVDDCVGDWKNQFDTLLTDPSNNTELVILNYDNDDEQAFQKTNVEILNTANKHAHLRNEKIMALVAWDGKSRGADDASAHFLNEAKKRRIVVEQINTL